MPNHDGTGPFGDGRPGKGMGPCGRYDSPRGNGFGRGCGRGFGHGRGFGFRYRGNNWSALDYMKSIEKQDMYPYTRENLQAQKEELEKQIKWVNDRITESEK